MRSSKVFLLTTGIALMAVLSVEFTQPTLAQGTQPPGRPSINVQAFNACTTTNYADLAAKALGMTVPAVRKALVSGQSLDQIATTDGISIQTVAAAIQPARNADIAQAVKDGVITQDEATSLEAPAAPGTPPSAPNTSSTQQASALSTPASTPSIPNGTQQVTGPGAGPRTARLPDISTLYVLFQPTSGGPTLAGNGNGGTRPGGGGGGLGGFGLNTGIFNLVKQYVTAATALNLKCADLVKTLITPPGKSVVTVAGDQKVDPQVVNDALVKAYNDALTQDVTDGVITQAQADQLTPTVPQAVQDFIYNALPMGRQQPPRQ